MAAPIAARRAIAATSTRLQTRTFSSSAPKLISLAEVKYTGKAKSVGGRNGHAELIGDPDHPLKVTLAMPKALGGSGKGNNPEQLFSLGYSACFLSSVNVAAKHKLPAEVSVEVHTKIGPPKGAEGFAVAADVIVRGNGSVDQDQLKKWVEAGHKICPYSRATEGNLDITFDVKA